MAYRTVSGRTEQNHVKYDVVDTSTGDNLGRVLPLQSGGYQVSCKPNNSGEYQVKRQHCADKAEVKQLLDQHLL